MVNANRIRGIKKGAVQSSESDDEPDDTFIALRMTRYLVLGACLLLVGCGGNASLPAKQEVYQRLVASNQVFAVHYMPPSMKYLPPEIHTIPAVGRYEPFLEKIKVTNPAETLKSAFLSTWQPKLAPLTVTIVPEAFPYRDGNMLRTMYARGLVLEFDVEKWLVGGTIADHGLLHVQFDAFVLLTDPAINKHIWRGACSVQKDVIHDGTGSRMSMRDVEKLQWEPLIKTWDKAANDCAEVLVKQFFGEHKAE